MKTIDGIQIANNIKAERIRAGITIEEVCSKLNISKPTYIEYEKNASKIQTSFLIKLSNLFECNINMFFYTKEINKMLGE